MANVRKLHKHAEVIRAYADGHEIQCYDVENDRWFDTAKPSFVLNVSYRVKPEPKKHKYRVALFSSDTDTWTRTEESSVAGVCTGYRHFVRYLTDWIEVEV